MDDDNDNMMLFCSICFEAYDENNKAPRILPGCNIIKTFYKFKIISFE